MFTANISNPSVTLKFEKFTNKSGEITFSPVKGGKKVSFPRVPVATLAMLDGETVTVGKVSGTFVVQETRPEGTRGKQSGNWAPRAIATLIVATDDGNVNLTVALTTEKDKNGNLLETAKLSAVGKVMAENSGGPGRAAAPTVSLNEAFALIGE
jgi:hypothetical protein